MKPSATLASNPAEPLPVLPPSVVELILALAPVVNPFSPVSTPALLTVLPRTAAPLAYCTLLLTANDYTWYMGIRTAKTSSDVLPLFRSLFPGYDDDKYPYRYACLAFMVAVTKADMVYVLKTLRAGSQIECEEDAERVIKACVQGRCIDALEWWVACLKELDMWPLGNMESVVHEAIELGHVCLLGHLIKARLAEWCSTGWDCASRHGQVGVLSWAKQCGFLETHAPGYQVLDLASGHGHVNVLNWWCSNYNIEKMDYSVDAMDKASANNHVGVLDWWTRSGLPLKFTPQAYVDALNAGHRDAVQFWFECGEYRHLSTLSHGGEESLQLQSNPALALRRSQCDLDSLSAFGQLQWIQAWFPSIGEKQLVQACTLAARFGHVPVLEHFCMQLAPAQTLRMSPHPLTTAAEHGQLHVVQWILAHAHEGLFADQDHCASVFAAVYGAIQNGHIGVLACLFNDPKTRSILAKDNVSSVLLPDACEFGSVGALSLLAAEAGQTLGQTIDCLFTASYGLTLAARNRHVQVFDWWECSAWPWPLWQGSVFECPIKAALDHSDSQLLDWILQHPGCGLQWDVVTERMVAELIVGRQEKSVRWLQNHAKDIGLCKWAEQRLHLYLP